MLPEMFCSANDCDCRPATAVVNASKIPMTCLHNTTAAHSRTPRRVQQGACHQLVVFYQWLTWEAWAALVQICRSGGKICRAGAVFACRFSAKIVRKISIEESHAL